MMFIVLVLVSATPSLASVSTTPVPALSFRGSGQMRQEDIAEALGFELTEGGERLEGFMRDLKDMYTSLPKNENGLVGHQLVRYALHRYFLHRHGWFVRGLEPGNATWTPLRQADGQLPAAFVKEWVPTYLQNTIERKRGEKGMDLRDMATMAATLEDLIRKEVEVRLKMVYDVHSTSVNLTLDRVMTDDLLSTYLMTFLLANNVTAKSRDQLMLKRHLFTKKYKGYKEVHAWWSATVAESLGKTTEIDFKAVSKVVRDIGEKFHTFNDIECNDLRSTLRTVESRKQGRVRLSTFYNMSRHTHWRFTEKAEYLKTLGALDETDPKNPSVIIANYVLARPNCLEVSNLYAICCRNTCEDLMAHIEREVGHARTTPERVSTLVASLSSESVDAPRQLSPTLLSRLDQVAAHHGGEVPLHGRLFSQWMHHAFPRECPFPHEQGTINPQTADEWIRDSGTNTQETESEMHERIQKDVCAINWEGNPECGEEVTDLPWNPVEELLSEPHSRDEVQPVRSVLHILVLGIGLLTAMYLFSAWMGTQRSSLRRHVVSAFRKHWSLVFVGGAVFWAYYSEMLQEAVFLMGLGGCCLFYLFVLVAARRAIPVDEKGCLPLHSKGI